MSMVGELRGSFEASKHPCLTRLPLKSYNNIRAEVAQLVEQRTENPRVPSSILGLGTKVRAEVAQR